MFGAALVPLSQAVLLDINPQEQHGQAMAIWGVGIMVGPILGPTLGGWLTETLQLALGVLRQPAGRHPRLPRPARLPAAHRAARLRGFDFFGFAMLALAIGALQLMLDRGEQVDWFSSTEIWIELGLAICRLLGLRRPHRSRREHPFIDPRSSATATSSTGAGASSSWSASSCSPSLALLPPMLQNLMDYPVMTTGLVLAPRGVGTMISMIVVGRLIGKVDARLLIVAGLLLTALLALADDRLHAADGRAA